MNTIKELRHEVTKIANEHKLSNLWIEISTNLVNDRERFADWRMCRLYKL